MKTYVPETLIKNIEIPELFVRTKGSPDEDKTLFLSIKNNGIFDPVILIRNGERFMLVKGSRRIEQATKVGILKVPYIAYDLPKGQDMTTYALRQRMMLGENRQDLWPSQVAVVIQKLIDDRGVTKKAIAKELNVDVDTLGNWLAVLDYIPKVVTALDEGKLTMQGARVFIGMTPVGQETIWRLHGEELMRGEKVDEVRARLRAQYPPAKFPHFYKNPELVEARLKRFSGKRRPKFNPTADDKKKMLVSYDLKEEEEEQLDDENAQLERRNDDTIPVLSAMLYIDEIRAKIPESFFGELNEFAAAYLEDRDDYLARRKKEQSKR